MTAKKRYEDVVEALSDDHEAAEAFDDFMTGISAALMEGLATVMPDFVRRYHNDAAFHAQVEMFVQVASEALRGRFSVDRGKPVVDERILSEFFKGADERG